MLGADDRLDSALLAAHAANDLPNLSRLYTQAADLAETRGDVDATCFFLTQAYVFALQADCVGTGGLHARLVAYRREE